VSAWEEEARDFILARCIPEPNTGCWLWTGTIVQPGGYGCGTFQRKRFYAHRLSFAAFLGRLLNGLVIDHVCRQRSCVNPHHLRQVTLEDNTLARGSQAVTAKNLRAETCIRGHEFDKRDRNGHRYCSVCHRIIDRRHRAALRARLLGEGA
jgi:hypothetical protein